MTEPASEASVDEAPRDDLADPLNRGARAMAVALGTAATGAGAVAVFVTSNQAGTAVLLLVGAVLVLLGLQGTPLRSFGGGDYRFELAQLRRRAAAVVEEAVRQESPDVAAAVAEAVSAIDPGIRFPDWPTMLWEGQVRDAVEAAGASVEAAGRSAAHGRGVDIRAHLPEGTVNIEVVYRKRGVVTSGEIAAAAAKLVRCDLDGGHLIVTNEPPPADVVSRAANLLRLSEPIDVVPWSHYRDTGELSAALRRNAR
ncbi:hypothetical protein [Micromonospora sp. B9E7]|uniref:hypothetical protein n=1 Tax=Micromonospora sp. B9E7 TaxID=3153574 RepID=UPI00325E2D80